jgi:3-oxoadipate enol-lactonase
MGIVVEGNEIHHSVEGPAQAPVVTFSHSLATDLTMWDAQVAALVETYRIVRYDIRGHGGSQAPPGPYTVGQLAADVRGLLAALAIERTYFVGLSLGGMIGQVLALESPELLRGLALCDTSGRVPAESRPAWEERIATARRGGLGPLVEPTLERWFTPHFFRERPAEAERIRQMLRGTSVEGYTGCCEAIARFDVADRLPSIEVPTLIVVGEEDPGTPVAVAESLHRSIARSELVVLPGARHLSNVEQPAAFNQALTGFLARTG